MDHALKVEHFLITLGWFVTGVGVLGIAATIGAAVFGDTSWQRALAGAFGILAATVLSGAAAYGSGTNIGLSAMRLQRDLAE